MLVDLHRDRDVPMSRPMTSGAFTVIASTRREWAAGDKRRILAQAGEPGANISEVARRNGVAQSLLYRWRKDAAIAARRSMSFVPVALTTAPVIELPSSIAPPAGQSPSHAIVEVVLANGRLLRASAEVDVATLARIVRALEAAA